MIKQIAFLLLIILSFSCSNDDNIKKSAEKQITSFVFLFTNNPIDKNIVATIDEENKTITAAMPPGTDLSGLLPEVRLSDLASINPDTAQNFTNPLVYTVTAEHGSTSGYTVTITALLTQRQILRAILDANPGNILDWDLDTTANLGDLEGVTINTEGQIIELAMAFSNLISIPSEIGQLTKLIILDLRNNELSELPPEIGQLTNLTKLILGRNQLTSLPPEIGELTNLTGLSLIGNQLTAIPPEIGFLLKLEFLDISNNDFNVIPRAVCYLEVFHDTETIHSSSALCGTFSSDESNALVSIYSANSGNTLGWGVDNYPGVEFTEGGKVKTITANNKNLERIPFDIVGLNFLEVLNINGNSFIGFNALPTEINRLSTLTTLTLAQRAVS